jgi:PAS domain S-box-containing protein
MQVQADWNRAIRFGTGKILVFLKVLIPGILLCLSNLSGFATFAETNTKNVLILHNWVSLPQSWTVMESTVRTRVPGQINFYTVSLANQKFDQEAYRASLAETLRHGYGGMKLDAVVAATYPVLEFAMKYRERLFPGVPIVFTDVSSREVEKTWSGVTGVVSSLGMRETIDLALHLNPDTKAVAVISGVSDWEKYWFAVAHSELVRHQDKVREIDIIGPPTAEILEKVAALPPHTVALFQMRPDDLALPALGVLDILAGAVQRVPTYSAWPGLSLERGGVGGAYRNFTKDAALNGEIVARVLSGERPEDIPVVRDTSLQTRVNWHALQRWHIPESALPAGTEVLYRPPSLWESYQRYIIAVAGVIFALLVLIAGLLWERARKRKAEALLRESEKRFRVMADTTPSLVWMCDPQGKITYLNERRIAFTGRDPNAGFDVLWTTYIHPDDRKNVLDVVSHALETHQPFTNEYRLRRSDGVYRWMFDVASPRVSGDRSFAGFISSGIDVTDQKLAQQALEKVSGQLIEAQENERRRIARDLHDDICQRLALLSMELDQANRSANEPADVAQLRLREIRQHCAEIAGDVQSLSHELHSSRLDYLGIVAAIRGFCHEFSKQHEINIEFADQDVPADLPRDISLCLFRVTQEALHNAVKYSGVSQYTVELTATEEEVQLVVSDTGKGFDTEAAKQNRGLGLVSMQERVHLVHGSLLVESVPGKGTRIYAVVPFSRETQRSLDTGSLEEMEGVTGAA